MNQDHRHPKPAVPTPFGVRRVAGQARSAPTKAAPGTARRPAERNRSEPTDRAADQAGHAMDERRAGRPRPDHPPGASRSSAGQIAARWEQALATYDHATATPGQREWHAGAPQTAAEMIQTWRGIERAEAEQAQATCDQANRAPELEPEAG